MIILDTDHLVVLKYSQGHDKSTLTTRMAASSDQHFVTTVITLEEQLRGWLASLRRFNDPGRQVSSYAKLSDVVDYFSRWTRLPFDDEAARQFQVLRRGKIRVATMDLKIPAIALVHNSLLLSANLRDFEQVPNLRVEDWLH